MREQALRSESLISPSDGQWPARPVVWVLADDRPGNTTQSLGLADALRWPYTIKRLNFTSLAWLHQIHERLLGATTICLDKKTSSPLTPPWPDVVISAGRRTAPIARWIRKQSHGCVKLIQLGRKGSQSNQRHDVTVTPRYCRMWPNDWHIETLAPLNRVTTQQLEGAAHEWSSLYQGAPQPHIVLLVGGSTVRYVFDEMVAKQLGKDVATFTQKLGGTVHAITSRRTGQLATNALIEGLGASGIVRRWEPGQTQNPYWGYLAIADIIIVTGESESMIGESVSVGKPVYIYALPQKPLKRFSRIREAIVVAGRKALNKEENDNVFRKSITKCCSLLLRHGIVRPLRDLHAFHVGLFEHGYAFPFGQEMKTGRKPPLRESVVVSQKVKALLGFQES